MEKYAGAQVDYLDFLFGVGLDQYVFWLQIGVDDMQSMYLIQCQQDLTAVVLKNFGIEVLGVHFVGIQEAVLEELGDQHEMFFVVEVIMQSEEMALLSIAVGRDIPQQFDFVDGLIEVVLGIGGFVVLDYFYTIVFVIC